MLYPNQNTIAHLFEPLTIDEVKIAIQPWPTDKASGPDGFYRGVLQNLHRHSLPYIFATLQAILTSNLPLAPLNDSHIILIPKKPTAN